MKTYHPFFEHIREQHPNPENFSNFLDACHRPLRKSIRVNTLKISVANFKVLALKRGWLLSPVPWCAEGFWISNRNAAQALELGNSGEHLLGLFYIQEASSMLPAVALLHNNPAELVLDMAAAPGSKTTQLAALMANKGSILANELSASRLKVLHANLQRTGVNNTCLSHFDGVDLHKGLEGYFDAVLVDAPCSGEGTYRKDPKALDNWSLKAINKIASVQKQLLYSAWQMLKPGGRLVYSTCTLSREENQDVVNWLRRAVDGEINLIPLDKLFTGASDPLTEEGYLQIWPEMFDCEGFFVACMEKKSAVVSDLPCTLLNKSPFKALDNKTSALVEQYYQQHFGFDLTDLLPRLKIRTARHQQQIWLLPEHGEQLRQRLIVQRSGIRICDLIDSRKGILIKTKNEFVINFGNKFSSQTIELDAASASACYKGENIIIGGSDLQQGEIVICYQGHPLGLAKLLANNVNTKLKNNLPRELLRNNVHF